MVALRRALAWLANRVDRAQYALACDDECCAHYNTQPSFMFRAYLASKAFLTGR